MIRNLTLALLTVLLATPVVFAQEPAKKMAVNDSLFTAAAADSGAAEVALSQLGMKKATSDELKSFSQKMVGEHTQLNKELMDLAAQKRIPVARTIDARAQFCAQSLAGLSGEEFDRCYAKAQLTSHMEAAATFEAEAERGQDRDIKALAAKALPKIKEHLAMIKSMAMKYEKQEGSTAPAK